MQISDEIPKDCLEYHPHSRLRSREGYYPNITIPQMEAYKQLKIRLESANLVMYDDGEHEFLKALRFLRARKFNVDKAFIMIENDIKWRTEDDRYKLATTNIDDVIECDYATIYPHISCGDQGFDKEGQPVFYVPVGKWNLVEAAKICPMKKLLKFDAWHGFRLTQIIVQASKKLNRNIETAGVIFDMDGLGMNMLTADFFTYARGMSANDADHNPERAGWVMIINAHWVFRIAWNIIQTFVDELTKSKIMILGERSEWEPILKKHMDDDQIPVSYGGTLPNLTAEENIARAKILLVDETFVSDLKHLASDGTDDGSAAIDDESIAISAATLKVTDEVDEDEIGLTDADKEAFKKKVELAASDSFKIV